MQISHLQIVDAKSWKGLTTENHLGAIWNEEPQKASELISKIQQRNYGMDIKTFLKKYPTKKFAKDTDYTWDLESKGVDNIALVEARIDGTAVTAADQAGINFSEFELVFPKDWFSMTEVIVGHKNEQYPIRIKEEGRAEGSNIVYTCELMTGDPNLFIPYEEIVSGKLFSREYAPAESTLSQRGRKVQHKSNISMRNAFSRIRIEKETPGNMVGRLLIARMTTDDGKKSFNTWTHYESARFDEEFQNDINRVLMFGKSNRTTQGNYTQKGISGYEIKMGAGLREQCETSNYSTYTTFDIEDLASRLMDMAEDKLGADERSFMLSTGERGMFQFSKSIEEYSQLFTPVRDNSRIYKTTQSGVQMAQGYGGQFVEFNFNNNIKLNVSVMQMYDSKDRNKDRHPDGGVTESYRYDVWDIGTNNGQANIQLVAQEGMESEIHGYIAGLRDPYSPIGGRVKNMQSSKDGWEEHKYWQGGVMVVDPTRTTHFVYNG